MNTEVKPVIDIESLSAAPFKTRENLLGMAKALPKDSPRSYGNVLGFRNGKAAITSGFALLEYDCGVQGEFCVTRSMFLSGVTFPKWEMVIPPNDTMVSAGETLGREIMLLLGALTTRQSPLQKETHLAIKGGQAFIFNGEAKGYDAIFNPWVIKEMAAGLPKYLAANDCLMAKAGRNEEPMIIIFDNFKLVCVPVKQAN